MIPDLMSFLIDADNARVVEGKRENICKNIEEDGDSKNITGIIIILESAEGTDPKVFNFLREIDKCIPENIERKEDIERKLFILKIEKTKDELVGKVMLKYKKEKPGENEKKDGNL